MSKTIHRNSHKTVLAKSVEKPSTDSSDSEIEDDDGQKKKTQEDIESDTSDEETKTKSVKQVTPRRRHGSNPTQFAIKRQNFHKTIPNVRRAEGHQPQQKVLKKEANAIKKK